MTTLLIYLSLTYHWGSPQLVVEAGPEVWVERPQAGLTWVQVAPAVVVLDTEASVVLESRMSAWLTRPGTPGGRP